MELTSLYNFGREKYKEHFHEIILNFGLWFRGICHLNIFIFSSGGFCVQRSGTAVLFW